MVIDIFKARIKILLKEKDIVFWGLGFPLFLSTLLCIGVMNGICIKEKGQEQVTSLVGGMKVVRTFVDQTGRKDGIIYFLAVLAVACVLAGFTGCREMEDFLCYVSPKAIRINVAPIRPAVFFFCSMTAAWGIAMGELLLIIIYFKAVLGIHLEGPLAGWLLLLLLSTLAGVLISMLVGTTSQNILAIKRGEIAIFGVGSCILGGLINEEVKFYVDAYMPVIAQLNPTSTMVDGMLMLCLYGMTDAFYGCLVRLGVFDVLCFALLLFMIHRRRRV